MTSSPPPRRSLRLRPFGLLPVVLALLSGCGGGDEGGGATPPPPPPPPPVASVQFVGSAPGSLVVGSTAQLQARTLGASGTVLNGRPVSWTTSAQAVATVSGSGLVTAVAPGEARITATSEGQSAQLTLAVIPPPVASVEVSPAQVELEAGESAALTVVLRDASGTVLADRDVSWAASPAEVVGVSPDGVVDALSQGEALVTATSEGVVGGANVRVLSATAPRITSIEPAILVAGETATVRGVRFAPAPGENQVQIGGAPAEVLGASATELTVQVPERACLPEATHPVRVAVGNESAERGHPFRPASYLDVPVGELRVVRAPSDLCLQLPPSAEDGSWLVGVQSVSLTPDLRTPVLVTGRSGPSGGTGAGFRLPGDRRALRAAGPSAGVATPDAPDRWDAHQAMHVRHMEAEEALVAELRARGGPTALELPAPAAVPPSTAVGDTVPIHVVTGTCAASQPAAMEVRAVSRRAIVVTDLENPEGGYTQEELEGIAAFIDDQIFDRHEAYFGSFTDIDNNGRLVVVISKRVNDIGGLLGFVSTADFFSQQSCPRSNGGEFLYLITPEPDAPETSSRNKTNTLADLPRLASHEITHVVQLGRRVLVGQPSMPTWAVEGQANIGEEVTGRGVLGLAGGSNFGREQVLTPQEGVGTMWFRQRFSDIFRFFGYRSSTERREGAPEGCGWLGREGSPAGISGPCESNRLPYGVAWSFLRWVSDHYAHRAGGEAGFNREIVELPTASLPELGNLVGEDHRDLLAYWAATLYTDDRSDLFEPRLTFPSWNLRDIENYFVATVRLTPYEEGFTSFERALTLASGSSAYLRVSGANPQGTAIQVQSASGGTAPGTVQLWVVRLP